MYTSFFNTFTSSRRYNQICRQLKLISLGIINSKYVAGVVRDGRFSGHMINEKTQVVCMEEWTSDSLSCEDAKRILQGKNNRIRFNINHAKY